MNSCSGISSGRTLPRKDNNGVKPMVASSAKPTKDNLETLERILQKCLHLELLYVIPLQVECFTWEDILIVLIQHSPQIVPNTAQVFKLVEKEVLAQDWSTNQQVQAYIRAEGQKEPHAAHAFKLPRSIQTVAESEPTPLHVRPINLEALIKGEPPLPEEPPAPVHIYIPPVKPPAPAAKPRRSRPPVALLVGLMSAAIGAGLVGFAVLGRPCVIGSCPALANAKQLSVRSTTLFISPTPANGGDILLAQKELEQAIATLRQVPPWSGYYRQAQTELRQYLNQAQRLDQVVSALKKAAKAAEMTQKLPVAEPVWRESQTLWREAIAQMESISPGHEAHKFAKVKIQQYQQQLQTINLGLVTEQVAVKNLAAAKENAQAATARQGVAQSLGDWQAVASLWRDALNKLEAIPATTTPYKEAQELRQSFQPKQRFVSDRTQLEQIAQKVFDQGIQAAEAAQKAGTDNRWDLAVNNWIGAIDAMERVPRNTNAYDRAQPLAQAYTTSLRQAQGNLEAANVQTRAKADLGRTCSGNPAICTYEIASNTIRVRLSATYTDQMRQTAIIATMRGDNKSHASVLQHINTLQQALQTISNNSRLNLEIYDANGFLIAAHTPR